MKRHKPALLTGSALICLGLAATGCQQPAAPAAQPSTTTIIEKQPDHDRPPVVVDRPVVVEHDRDDRNHPRTDDRRPDDRRPEPPHPPDHE